MSVKYPCKILLYRRYRHPCMPLSEFNEDFLQPLFVKLSSENNKKNNNVDLLKADNHLNSSAFLDIIETNSILSKTLLPTQVA